VNAWELLNLKRGIGTVVRSQTGENWCNCPSRYHCKFWCL